jgi:hypothetical protein
MESDDVARPSSLIGEWPMAALSDHDWLQTQRAIAEIHHDSCCWTSAAALRSDQSRLHSISVHGACDFARLLASRLHDHTDKIKTIDASIVQVAHRTVQASPSIQVDDLESEQQTCFVCLESEGVMLVNTCACKWSKIHPTCLDRLLATGRRDCSVCRFPIAHKPMRTLVEQLWEHHFVACSMHVVASICMAAGGFYVFAVALLIHSHPARVAGIVFGIAAVLYACTNLHALLNEGWPTACPCQHSRGPVTG